MKLCFLCFLTVLRVFTAGATEMHTTPVQKVITLLQGMLEKGKKEKHEEEVLFTESRQFCEDEESTKTLAINEEVSTIEGLTALIAKDTADAAHLLKLISVLDKDEDVWSGDIKAATKVRDIEKADYSKTHKDYSESIEAIEHAVQVLKKQSHDRKQQEEALVQLSSLHRLTPGAKRALDAFFQQEDGESTDDRESTQDSEMGAPEANAYEFQSHGVVDMLQKLLDKFIDERTNLEKEETNSQNAYTLLMQDLKAQIVQAVKDKHGKQLSRSKRLASKADESGDKKKEEELEVMDTKYLKDLQADCKMKASDFKNRQELRSGEIEAIEQAIEIMSGDAVKGNAEKHLPALLQPGATSLSQLRSTLTTAAQQHLTAFLNARAAKAQSSVLAAVALRVGADPFAKVQKMLKDLVVRLMEEANEEAEHKGWCDTELATNGQTRKEKTETVENLQADIDSLKASIAKLTEDIGSLSKAVADLDAATAKSTKIRTEEKAKNAEAVEDSQEAQTAVAQALTVLREFYAKAAEATSFVQEPYKGMQGESGGIVGMLEVIESDFARIESETKAAEATAQKEYDSFVSDSKEDRAEKATAAEHKAAKKQDETQELTAKKNDLEGSQKELDAALKYFDKLKPSCVDSGVSYEDRVERRQQEIQSLQEGLKILNGEDIA